MSPELELPTEKVSRPALLDRLLAAIPLLFLYVILHVILVYEPKFEQMYKEMDLGGLPFLTTALFAFANTVLQFWFLFLPALFALTWLFFAWGCKTKSRMRWCSFAVSLIAIFLFWSGFYGTFLPLVTIMGDRQVRVEGH